MSLLKPPPFYARDLMFLQRKDHMGDGNYFIHTRIEHNITHVMDYNPFVILSVFISYKL